MRSIINILDLSAGEIDQLIAVADDIMAQPEKYNEVCRHKILATLFFEPSTRTRLSFESAMLSLGGQVIGFSGADSSSAVKGETIADTIEVVNGYADIIAMRHPKEGAPVVASMHTAVPLINAGDGGHFHPTQTLADLLTIHHEKGTFDNLTIGLCGDLKYGARRSLPGGGISLHSRRIEFEHPVRREPLSVTAPVPAGDNLWAYFENL
ncbi:MAG: hypothetical protein EGR44_08140 [Ruminococcaceae bacterium]|nr:hypothetical protein [Oscillospiraceae bacterium]